MLEHIFSSARPSLRQRRFLCRPGAAATADTQRRNRPPVSTQGATRGPSMGSAEEAAVSEEAASAAGGNVCSTPVTSSLSSSNYFRSSRATAISL